MILLCAKWKRFPVLVSDLLLQRGREVGLKWFTLYLLSLLVLTEVAMMIRLLVLLSLLKEGANTFVQVTVYPRLVHWSSCWRDQVWDARALVHRFKAHLLLMSYLLGWKLSEAVLARLQSSLLVTLHIHIIHLCTVHPLFSSLQRFCSNQFVAELLNQKRWIICRPDIRHGSTSDVLDVVCYRGFCNIYFSRCVNFISFRPFQLLIIRQTRRFHDLVDQWLSGFRWRTCCCIRICRFWIVQWRQKSIIIQVLR